MAKGPEGIKEEGATKSLSNMLVAGVLVAAGAVGVHGISTERANERATCNALAKGESLTDVPFTFSPTVNLFHQVKEGTFLNEDTLAAELEACQDTHRIQASVACAAASVNKTIQAGGTIPSNLAAEATRIKSECEK